MNQHLPNDVFWAVAQHCDDVKACVSMWTCCKGLYRTFDKHTFWDELSYIKFNTTSKQTLPPTPELHCQKSSQPSQDIFWINYAKQYGCINCHKPFARNRNFNNFVDHVKLYDMSLYTCSTCRSVLGDNLVHKRYIEPWQTNLLKKIKTSSKSCNLIFNGYYGVNQVHQSNGYKTKCVTCIKNIRNCLCPHFKCGACCGCKYHKSHYHQLQHQPYMYHSGTTHTFSFASSSGMHTTMKMKNHQKNKNIKLHHNQQGSMNTNHQRSKRYYLVSIEI
jgi:hypothetical protein